MQGITKIFYYLIIRNDLKLFGGLIMSTATFSTIASETVKGLVEAFRLTDCIEVIEEQQEEAHFITLFIDDDVRAFSTLKNNRKQRIDKLINAISNFALEDVGDYEKSSFLAELEEQAQRSACYDDKDADWTSEQTFEDYHRFEFWIENSDNYEVIEVVTAKALRRFLEDMQDTLKEWREENKTFYTLNGRDCYYD